MVNKYKLYQAVILHNISHRLLRDFVNSTLEEYSINIASWSLLDLLLNNNKLSFNEIAATLNVDAPFVTELITDLEKRRLVEVIKSQEDKRVKVAALSIDGFRMSKKLNTIVNKKLTNFMKGCTAEELEVYFRVTEKIIENHSKKTEETNPTSN